MDILGYDFTGPLRRVAEIDNQQGVFAVLLLAGDALVLLDAGESRQLRMRLALHERRDEWENEAMARRGELRFAVRYTPGCRESGRQAIVTKLQKALGEAVGGP